MAHDLNEPPPVADPGAAYRICIKGILTEHWADWFDGMTLCHDDAGNTILAGRVADQAALHRLFHQIHGLGLMVIGVERQEA